MSVFSNFVLLLKSLRSPDQVALDIEKFDETISPNMRAIRLAMGVTDVLIAMGVSVSDVVSMGLDITDRYCKRKVQFDISSTLLTASQDRGNEREPLTMVRHSQPRTTNYMTVQSIQEMVRDIRHGRLTLERAEKHFDDIIAHPRKYPRWAAVSGSALISAGVGVIFGATPIIVAIMFGLGAIVSYLLRYLVHKRVPTFFAQVFSAIAITLTAAVVAWMASLRGWEWLDETNPTLIVIGGIVLLVAGLAIVGAVADAIDEFYVTANARLLKVVMMTIGIVAGVLIGLYFAKQFGVYVEVDADVTIKQSDWAIVGAFIVALGYALGMQAHPVSVLASGLMGALSWLTYIAVLAPGPMSAIAASGIAATAVGVAATLVSRVWHTPSVALITAGIVPLVPGLALYEGLFALVGNSAGTTTIDEGLTTLFSAGLIALAIASGASFGHLIARPVRRTVVRARNALPSRRYSN